MLVLICSPQPDPSTGRAFPSASLLAGPLGLGLCRMTVLLLFGWVRMSPARPIWKLLSAGDLLEL